MSGEKQRQNQYSTFLPLPSTIFPRLPFTPSFIYQAVQWGVGNEDLGSVHSSSSLLLLSPHTSSTSACLTPDMVLQQQVGRQFILVEGTETCCPQQIPALLGTCVHRAAPGNIGAYLFGPPGFIIHHGKTLTIF